MPLEHIQRRINNTTVFTLNNSDIKVLPLAISLSSVVLVRTKLLGLTLVLVLVLVSKTLSFRFSALVSLTNDFQQNVACVTCRYSDPESPVVVVLFPASTGGRRAWYPLFAHALN